VSKSPRLVMISNRYFFLSNTLSKVGADVSPLLARLLFGLTLFAFFWKSAFTKFDDGLAGLWTPSVGAYAQILPTRFETVGYDPSAMNALEWAIVIAGSYAELVLPMLIVIGLFTRFAALGMVGFILVMSFVDVSGHGIALGSLLDSNPSTLIPDQRLFWIFPLIVLTLQGGGFWSVDRLLFNKSRQE